MKKLELYLYIVLGLIALLPFLFLHWMTQAEALQIAHYTALPFLAWIALSAYYLLRWCVWRVRSASKKSRRAKA